MDNKLELVRKVMDYGIIKDPQWLERLDDPAPLWVLLEALLSVIERLDPPNQPFD
ncbi:hypothetical protein [Paenibacillus protaetiae]|uniref:hypothetical protein n=1 Tax=Paenibacillus protaetiae TaxID=2509456 RepID=UPI0013ED5146|nr:hypothetical protein [Paenibacillus protaetiae]